MFFQSKSYHSYYYLIHTTCFYDFSAMRAAGLSPKCVGIERTVPFPGDASVSSAVPVVPVDTNVSVTGLGTTKYIEKEGRVMMIPNKSPMSLSLMVLTDEKALTPIVDMQPPRSPVPSLTQIMKDASSITVVPGVPGSPTGRKGSMTTYSGPSYKVVHDSGSSSRSATVSSGQSAYSVDYESVDSFENSPGSTFAVKFMNSSVKIASRMYRTASAIATTVLNTSGDGKGKEAR
jgi:hypothetical protein